MCSFLLSFIFFNGSISLPSDVFTADKYITSLSLLLYLDLFPQLLIGKGLPITPNRRADKSAFLQRTENGIWLLTLFSLRCWSTWSLAVSWWTDLNWCFFHSHTRVDSWAKDFTKRVRISSGIFVLNLISFSIRANVVSRRRHSWQLNTKNLLIFSLILSVLITDHCVNGHRLTVMLVLQDRIEQKTNNDQQ